MKKIIILFLVTICLNANAQIITTIAGNGTAGSSGDGGQATVAEFNSPENIAIDRKGNIYVNDYYSNRIRKIDSFGIITTIVGTGAGAGTYTCCYGGDGGQATAAKINVPGIMVFDIYNNLYFSDVNNNRIRKVDSLGIITTIVGTGISGYSGDGGQATAAQIGVPYGMFMDASGSIYFTEEGNNVIRKVNSLGIISTIAGTGVQGFNGDGGQATSAKLNFPEHITLDHNGNIYFSDMQNQRIRMINTSGIITTVAGTGFGTGTSSGGYSGDGGQATAAELNDPAGVLFDGAGNMYISDYYNNRIRMVNSAGIITTIAGTGFGEGTGAAHYSGDGGLATAAELADPATIIFDGVGNMYFADVANNRIRKISNVGIAAGINKISQNNYINIYPNPSNGNISIISASNIDNIKVTDMLGQIVYEARPNNENTILQINNVGVYFVTITNGKEVSTKKVIVNN
jgi:hypothetical protein